VYIRSLEYSRSQCTYTLQSIAKTASTLLIAFLFSGPTAKALARILYLLDRNKLGAAVKYVVFTTIVIVRLTAQIQQWIQYYGGRYSFIRRALFNSPQITVEQSIKDLR
jgi:hypothetical protein